MWEDLSHSFAVFDEESSFDGVFVAVLQRRVFRSQLVLFSTLACPGPSQRHDLGG